MKLSRRDVAKMGIAAASAMALPALARSGRPADGYLGMILAPGPDGHCDDLRVGVGTPHWAAERREWLMWYFGGDRTPSIDNKGKPGMGFRTLPGLAKSANGVNWTKVRGPGPGGALFGADDDDFASWPGVVYDGEKFVMIYTASKGDYDVLRSHHAVSRDGIHWEKLGQLRWTDEPLQWDEKGIIARNVMLNPFPGGPRFLMIYAGIDGHPDRLKRRSIMAAVSEDGSNWRHLYRDPIFTIEGSAGWDAGEVTAPHLIVTENVLRLFYLGGAGRDNTTGYPRGMGLAISPGHDLRNFKRYDKAVLAT